MTNWKEWFERTQREMVSVANYEGVYYMDIEGQYQAFKARMIAEAESEK